MRIRFCWLVALVLPGVAAAEPTRAAAAETAATDASEATEILVAGRRQRVQGLTVTTLNERDIERYGQTSVAQTLERLPALQGSGDRRGERIFTLRGFTQRQVATYVDGVPLAVPYDGQVDLDKLPIDTVERITVNQGSAPLLLGPNGLGGVINVTTREPSARPSLRLLAEGAPFYATRSSGALSARLGKEQQHGFLLGAAYENRRHLPLAGGFVDQPNQSGERRTNSDRVGVSLTGKWNWDITPRHRIGVQVARFGGEYGVSPGTRDFVVRYWRWSEWDATVASVGHVYSTRNFSAETRLYGSWFSNTLDAYDDARYASQRLPKAFHTTYDDTAFGGFVRAALNVPDTSLRLTTWNGVRRDTHGDTPARGAETTYVSTHIVTASMAAEAELPAGFAARAGAQLDAELPATPPSGPRPGNSAGVGPMGSLSWARGGLTVALQTALRTRTPTLRERFSTVFGGREPNPGLRPERALNSSLDASYTHGPFTALGSLFHSELDDLVTEVYVRPQVDQLQNVGKARVLGAEGRLSFAPVRWLDASLGFTAMSARRLDGAESRLAYRPSHKGTAMLTLIPTDYLSVTVVGREIGGQHYQDTNDDVWGHLPAYRLVDARVDLTVERDYRLWLRVSNLGDANVLPRFSFPEAGRQFFIGFGTRLGS